MIHGLIARRVLVNFRVRPDVLQAVLPPPFRVRTVGGSGMAGICLIRLSGMRPPLVPRFLGLSSENAAHRIAVEWDTEAGPQSGVFIPRRDTASLVNRLVGGRLFPGEHHGARFAVRDGGDEVAISLASLDGAERVEVAGRVVGELPGSSVFPSLAAASEFFEQGSMGWSATARAGCYEGLELECRQWQVRPLAVDRVESSFFADAARFPAGTMAFDSALLMRDIPCIWRAHRPWFHGVPQRDPPDRPMAAAPSRRPRGRGHEAGGRA